jgi:hypothetical protein
MSSLRNPRSAHYSPPALVPSNGEPQSLPDLIDDEARAYRDRGDSIGRFIADHLDRLAQLVRWTGATTPDHHEERMEIYDDELRAKWFDHGFDAGLQAARDEYGLSLNDRY